MSTYGEAAVPVDVDLRDFLKSYAEEVPQVTVYKCTVLGSAGQGRVRLNMRPSEDLKFSEKAYNLFRVIEKANGTVDILLGIDKLVLMNSSRSHT